MNLTHGYSAAQVRAAEQPLLDAGEPLMLRAATGLAGEVLRRLGDPVGRRVLVLAGAGNNGGDALYAAATLAEHGALVTVVPLGERLHEGGLAAAREAGAVVVDRADAAAHAERCDVVLDGILGTGAAASPALREPARSLVAGLIGVLARRDIRPLVVAVDLPSGTGADDGSVHEPVLRADVTVTLGALKAGLLLPPAADVAGEVVLVDIGLGPQLAGVEPLVRS
ncbi:NAD(P)H-hydrate epimerase [Desertivibrio insolitus]|uniref:NAD(P)H-hydrate epimerase n=1 Tax=Herbiconiux sp. SYSU D00978 TaxID=2812562 RepID=UPI0027DD6941|nr:NAD(P)H-hydrate epimerase [Herbiconiux sp. SYSU D00978]